MNHLANKVFGATIGCVGFYVAYDYNTCHPMRKMMGYDVSGALVRFYNTAIIPINPVSSRTMTLEELSKYDGTNGKPIYFASDGYVWDVTESEMFKDTYGLWKGKDATIALAKMSMDRRDVNRIDWNSLSAKEWESCHSWTRYFLEKYYIKGKIKEFEKHIGNNNNNNVVVDNTTASKRNGMK